MLDGQSRQKTSTREAGRRDGLVELRVTVTQSMRSTVLHVDGRLTAGNLGHLERLVATVSGVVVLDLSNLMSVDDAGLATLRSLGRRGARLVGVTPYVSLLLTDESAPPSRQH